MRIVVIIGLPGSGKSFYAKSIVGDKVILSSDDYFTDENGNYNWTVEKSHEGHEDCLRKFINHIMQSAPSLYVTNTTPSDFTLVVDNTNLRLSDISPYIRIAQAYGITPRVVYVKTPIDLAKSRNIHNVPNSTYDKMQDNLEFLLENWPKDFPVFDILEGYDNKDYAYPVAVYAACPEMPQYLAASAYACCPIAEDQYEFDVILIDSGKYKILIIKWIRENTDLSLADCRKMVDNLPQDILTRVSKDEAIKCKRELEDLGAKVKVR